MSRSITITVPGQAPSKSNYRHHSKDWRKKWKRIKGFEEAVGKAAIAAGAKQMRRKYNGSVHVHTATYKQRIDPSNAEKAIHDALQGICYDNDKTISNSCEAKRDKGKARIVITITFS